MTCVYLSLLHITPVFEDMEPTGCRACCQHLSINPLTAPARKFSGLKSAHRNACKQYAWRACNNSTCNTVHFGRSPFTCSDEEGEKPEWVQIWHFCWSFFEWRCGKYGSERVNADTSNTLIREEEEEEEKTKHLLLTILYNAQLQGSEGSNTFSACWVILCFHSPSNSDKDYGVFNVRVWAFCMRMVHKEELGL